MLPRERISRRGRFQLDSWLLVLPPAKLPAGGVDVHIAWPRPARADGRRRLAELHLALLLPHHRPFHCADHAAHAESDGARCDLVVWGGLALLAARRPAL